VPVVPKSFKQTATLHARHALICACTLGVALTRAREMGGAPRNPAHRIACGEKHIGECPPLLGALPPSPSEGWPGGAAGVREVLALGPTSSASASCLDQEAILHVLLCRFRTPAGFQNLLYLGAGAANSSLDTGVCQKGILEQVVLSDQCAWVSLSPTS